MKKIQLILFAAVFIAGVAHAQDRNLVLNPVIGKKYRFSQDGTQNITVYPEKGETRLLNTLGGIYDVVFMEKNGSEFLVDLVIDSIYFEISGEETSMSFHTGQVIGEDIFEIMMSEFTGYHFKFRIDERGNITEKSDLGPLIDKILDNPTLKRTLGNLGGVLKPTLEESLGGVNMAESFTLLFFFLPEGPVGDKWPSTRKFLNFDEGEFSSGMKVTSMDGPILTLSVKSKAKNLVEKSQRSELTGNAKGLSTINVNAETGIVDYVSENFTIKGKSTDSNGPSKIEIESSFSYYLMN